LRGSNVTTRNIFWTSTNYLNFAAGQVPMTYRYAAALALVGWYLMLPPPMALTPRFDSKAPLDKRTIRGSKRSSGGEERGAQRR
jgi:hypothetical protein